MNKENTDRSHVQNVIPEVHASEKNEKPKNKLSFTTDNTKDISGALKGTYYWLGCVAHYTLVVNSGNVDHY